MLGSYLKWILGHSILIRPHIDYMLHKSNASEVPEIVRISKDKVVNAYSATTTFRPSWFLIFRTFDKVPSCFNWRWKRAMRAKPGNPKEKHLGADFVSRTGTVDQPLTPRQTSTFNRPNWMWCESLRTWLPHPALPWSMGRVGFWTEIHLRAQESQAPFKTIKLNEILQFKPPNIKLLSFKCQGLRKYNSLKFSAPAILCNSVQFSAPATLCNSKLLCNSVLSSCDSVQFRAPAILHNSV